MRALRLHTGVALTCVAAATESCFVSIPDLVGSGEYLAPPTSSDPSDTGPNGSTNRDASFGGDGGPPPSSDAACGPSCDDASGACATGWLDCDQAVAGCETNVTSNAKHCGSCGHDCLGSVCMGGRCAATVLAADGGDAYSVAVDATHVYWTNHLTGGFVGRVPVSGGTTSAFAQPAGAAPYGIALDANVVFFSDQNGRIYRQDKGAAMSTAIASGLGLVRGLAVDGQYVYFSTPKAVHRVRYDGTDLATIATSADANIFGVAVGATDVYFTHWTPAANSYVLRAPKIGGASITVVTSTPSEPLAIVADGSDLYFLHGFGELLSVAAAGGSTRKLGGGKAPTGPSDRQVQGVAHDGSHVYWSKADEGVLKAPKNGTSAPQLIAAMSDVRGVAVDATRVYFAGPNAVYWVAK